MGLSGHGSVSGACITDLHHSLGHSNESLQGCSRKARDGDMGQQWQPSGMIYGAVARRALRDGGVPCLAGNPNMAFDSCEELSTCKRIRWPDVPQDVMEALSGERKFLSGLSDGGPAVMGIVNATPDSFFDGGVHAGIDQAIEHGRELHSQGAEIIDVGGESTRPGAIEVDVREELQRTVPVVKALAEEGMRVSIDTRKVEVMERCLEAGATIINDVQALSGSGCLEAAASSQALVILMHMSATPPTMQNNPRYDNVVAEVYTYLQRRIEACIQARIDPARIAIDPGIGFGKTAEHNRQLLSHIGVFHGLGCPIMIGVSRKRFISALSAQEGPEDRLPGSLAASLFCLSQGVQMLRVHDVLPTKQAISVWQALSQ